MLNGLHTSKSNGAGQTNRLYASQQFISYIPEFKNVFFIILLFCTLIIRINAQEYQYSPMRNATASMVFGENKGHDKSEELFAATFSGSIQPESVTVFITSSQDGNTCIGSPITFTASVVNGGTDPTIQWKVNGMAAGAADVVFVSSNLKTGDKVSCTVTCNTGCTGNTTANSNVIVVTIGSFVIPDITIAASPGNSICENSPVTFTSKVVNASAAPFYQWKLNGNNTGSNSSTFSSNSLVNGDIVSCELTNLSCNMTTLSESNSITMTVREGVMPVVSITASETNVCKGTSISFSATAQHAGNNPSYQWRVNGAVAGNNQTYSSANFSDNDIVQCLLLPEQTGCAGSAGILSNAVTIKLLPSPDFLITPDRPVISRGDTVQLSVTGINMVGYEWSPALYINNTAVINPKVWPDHTQAYRVTVTSANDCRSTKEVVVSIISDIFIPTGFTPNGDGLNDTWRIPGIELYPSCTVSIFDRSGNMVFRSSGYGIPWNGTYKGAKLSNASFVYLISFKDGQKPLCGTVTVIR